MIPKEKAKDLKDKFQYISDLKYREIINESKECALICVDEIIKEIAEIREYYIELKRAPNLVFKNKLEYFKEVKKEIEKS